MRRTRIGSKWQCNHKLILVYSLDTMVRITEELVRKRCEHNEGQISTLEELSLHQLDIEKLEHLDNWCRDLKILYLQSNLISKIENVSKLKRLEYLNLALNNITKIENLQGCESLKKLDLTVNFVGDEFISSVENLKENLQLRDLYLTGNPCVDFPGYRELVVSSLPQLTRLDGREVTPSERLHCRQEQATSRASVLAHQEAYRERRAQELRNTKKNVEEETDEDEDASRRRFTSEKTPYTPEARLEAHRHLAKLRAASDETSTKLGDAAESRPRRFFTSEGRPLNMNEAGVEFYMQEVETGGDACADAGGEAVVLKVDVWRHLDTSLLDVDVQPKYVRVAIKGKVLQLHLPAEVSPDRSTCQRSETTGQLVVTMPTVLNDSIKLRSDFKKKEQNDKNKVSSNTEKPLINVENKTNLLEVHPRESLNLKLPDQNAENSIPVPAQTEICCQNSPDFVDDPDVPALI